MRCIETKAPLPDTVDSGDILQHEMYWNSITIKATSRYNPINYNMRCIETTCALNRRNGGSDKLQHEMYWNLNARFSYASYGRINYNMRCIETRYSSRHLTACFLINYNMRCIETCRLRWFPWRPPDKLQHEMYWNNCVSTAFEAAMTINYNMRCIETKISQLFNQPTHG